MTELPYTEIKRTKVVVVILLLLHTWPVIKINCWYYLGNVHLGIAHERMEYLNYTNKKIIKK